MIINSSSYVVKTIIFTVLALFAFAANSVLCRLALGENAIDAPSFTVIRLLSGTIVLLTIIRIKNDKTASSTKGSWSASIMLFLYAVTFSFAYVTLDTGTGALILVGSVQITMILLSLISGDRLHILEWTGLTIAFMGFVYLILPEVTTPSATGFLLMTIAGIAWGVYTLKGRDSENPLAGTAFNFLRTTPLVIISVIISIKNLHYTTEDILPAVLSGGITSGIGYTIWYIAFAGLSATQAAVVQLLVPVIAAIGGVIFVNEVVTLQLTVASMMILGGILMAVLGRYYFVECRSGKTS